MRKITLVFTLIFAALLLFASCDYLDFDIPFLDVETDTEEPGQHTHEYGEIQSDSDSHFNICRCGDVINSEPHVEGKNGICTVCAYVVRDVFDVSVSADEGINITTTVYSVNRGDSLYFSVSTEQNRSLTVVGADKLSEEIYGNLVIHQ